MDDDNHDRDDTTKNIEQKRSENEGPAAQNSKLSQGFHEISQVGGDDDGSITTGNDEPQLEQVVSRTGESSSILATVGMHTEAPSPPQTLATLPSTDDLHCSSVNGDAEVPPVECGLQQSESAEEFKFEDQVAVPKKEERKSNADQTARAQSENLQETPDGTLSSELSPTSVTQFVSSMPSPVQAEQKMSIVKNRNISHLQEVGIKSSFDPKKLSVVSVQKTPSTGGYNWRKYGQKQVKSPQGFRSYYRCTHADCYAKKIECSDDSNRVTEIVYKSQHSHDPPQKINCTRGSRLSSSVAPVNGIDSSVSPTAVNTDSVPSTSPIDSVQEMSVVPEPEQKESSATDDIAETVVKHGHVDETEPRKRLKKTDSSCSESLPKAGNKPKYVVHGAGDVGISGDGYRWRKYGQKMVKGNPHPRNYYRCTSAGCPVRKLIERARDNTNAAIITYKGVHNHGVPIPKKRQGSASSPLVSASASMNTTQVVKLENTENQVSAAQCSVDREGELKGQTLECGGEKAVDSTRTLLSVGFEIKHN